MEEIDFYDKKKYSPIVINGISNEQKKYFATFKILKNYNIGEKEEILVLVANQEDFDSKLNRSSAILEFINLIKSNNFIFKTKIDVQIDKIRETYEKAAGLNGEEGGVSSQGVVKKEFDELLSYCLANNASDIHILALQSGAQILLRIDGDLQLYKSYSYEFTLRMSRAIYSVDSKELEGTHFKETTSQQSIIKKTIDGIDIQLRYQSTNIFGGFKIIMRILNLGRKEESDDKYKYLRLDKLGYAPSHIENIELGIAKPVGATIIAGVTGSGKSTTLKHLLMFMNHQTNFLKAFYTLEDPPEYLIPGVTQIGVSRNANAHDANSGFNGDSPYKKPLAVLMRADPDVIMIGEIRDEATAEGLVKATESGHKVLSTTHASSSLEIVKRLYNFGVGSNDMAAPSFLSCLIYQKLLPVLCEHCKVKLVEQLDDSTVSDRVIAMKNRLMDVADLNKDPIYIRNEKGCEYCDHKGAKGRTVCAETIVPDLTLLTFFRDNKMIEAKEYWRSLSDKNRDSTNFTGKTVLEHAISKMRQGLLSPMDIEIELGPINAAHKEWLEIEHRERKNREKLIDQYLFSGLKTQKNKNEEEFVL